MRSVQDRNSVIGIIGRVVTDSQRQLINVRGQVNKCNDPLADACGQVQALGPEWEADAIADAHDALREATSSADRQTQNRIENDVLPALAAARRALDDGDSLSATTAPDRLGGDLAEMVERAVDAFCEGHESAAGLLSAARTALAGGEDGCRELAAHARDGYAHPLAHLLLHGIIADGEGATEMQTKATVSRQTDQKVGLFNSNRRVARRWPN
jgi:microcompartment protein CcmL/EutN